MKKRRKTIASVEPETLIIGTPPPSSSVVASSTTEEISLQGQRIDGTLLDAIIQGQSERNLVDTSKNTYLAKVGVMTRLLNEKAPLDIRAKALELDAQNKPIKHTGSAKAVLKLKLPIDQQVAQKLFGIISVDTSLPRQNHNQNRRGEEGRLLPIIASCCHHHSANPAKDMVTVTSQTFQNYKSALKWWWHEYNCPSMEKIGYAWPAVVDDVLNTAIATYKRDIASKKRRGIMTQKEGKSPYNLLGYVTICDYFYKLKPSGNRFTWNEGMFAGLFTKLSVNTIGRSDNIDDLILSNMDWENDG